MGLDWNKLNDQKARLDEKLSKSGGSGAKFWKPQAGANRVRIMPGWTSEGYYANQFWREVAQHWNVTEDSKGPVLCPKKTPGLTGDCPVCALVTSLKKDKSDLGAQTLAKDLRAKSAYFLNVVDVSSQTYTAQDVVEFKKARPDADEVPFEVGEVKVQIYAAPATVFNQILNVMRENSLDITEVAGGKDITIRKSGKGLKTRYETTIIIADSETPVAEKLPALSEVGFQMGYDEMVDLLAGGAGAEYVAQIPSAASVGAPTVSNDAPSPDDAEALRKQLQAAAGS